MPQHAIKSALSERFRRARDVRLRAVIAACPRRGERLEILDLGGRADYWRRVGYDFLVEQGVRLTLLNLSEAELAVDPDAPEGLFRWLTGDGRALEFADDTFDLCHSNSVIEHVGGWDDKLAFAGETRRIASSYYVQTPNYWFPVDPHFAALPGIHWMPRNWRAWLLQRLPLAHSGKARDQAEAYRFVDSSRLLTQRQMRSLFPEGRILTERLLLLAKSFIATHIAEHSGAANQQRFSHG